mmetsp:Transcript_63019/g.111358  ORF Transcript_63019/g.111358 Transcript_63019/m.111358 type:complete len:93 (-) Transcript_63019:58-336(-)
MAREAENALQATADPLGPPPEAPKSWANVDAMARRAAGKERSLRTRVADLKSDAKHAGLSLAQVSLPEGETVSVDKVAEEQDAKLLDFLSKY